MLQRLFFLLIILLLLSGTAVAGQFDFRALSDSIDLVASDFTKQAQVSGLAIERGGVEFLLENGMLTLAEPVAGRVIAATFVGEGRFRTKPPNRAERFMLAKLCKDTLADWRFEKLALFFTDDTDAELSAALEFAPLSDEGGRGGLLADVVDYFEDEFKRAFAPFILPDLLQPNLPGRFLAKFECERGEMIFVYDPKEVEESHLWKHSRTASGSYPETVCSFHSPDQYSDSQWGPDHEDKDLIDSLEYRIDCKIWQSAKADLEVDLSFVSVVDGLRSLTFTIYDDLDLDNIVVLDAAADTLYWDKLKEEWAITVYFERPVAQNERSSLKFLYGSKELIQKTSWGNPILIVPTSWYPSYGYLKRASYQLRFSCPKQYTFLSVGRKVLEDTEGDFKITEWDLTEFPVSVASFNYGLFHSDSASLPDGTPLEVYGGKSHGAFSKSLREGVLQDLRAAGALYSSELAEYPFRKLWATEIPASHGQGLPGFIHLAWSSFELHEAGYSDAFVAHELAHQWWGHVVGWESYHDQWLSEGFAEYMAGWYVQRKYMSDELHKGRFFELLDDWRADVLESGSFQKFGGRSAYQEGNDAGPIWMGRRLASSKSSDYVTLVYSKGAYVLYMLRMLMFDFAKQDDSRFLEMLKDFISSNYWKEASTADFIRTAEKHYGDDLSWFFDQYVYDIQIPHYRWKANVVEDIDGQYLVTIDTETENVREDFQMLVPVTLVMEGDFHATVRIRIDQPKQRIRLPKVPYKPVSVVFNTYRSVLCTDQEM